MREYEYHEGSLGTWECGCAEDFYCDYGHRDIFVKKTFGPITPQQAERNRLLASIWNPIIARQLEEQSVFKEMAFKEAIARKFDRTVFHVRKD